MKSVNYKGIVCYISENGEVFSDSLEVKSQYMDKQGYMRVGLWCKINKETHVVRVHQLVAMAYLMEDYFNLGLVVNHKNLDKSDNRLENLEVISEKENSIHATVNGKNSKLKYIDIIAYSDYDSLFLKRLRLLEDEGFKELFGNFCRKMVAKAIESGVEYKNFRWTTLERLNGTYD